jgi:hypothetical protein
LADVQARMHPFVTPPQACYTIPRASKQAATRSQFLRLGAARSQYPGPLAGTNRTAANFGPCHAMGDLSSGKRDGSEGQTDSAGNTTRGEGKDSVYTAVSMPPTASFNPRRGIWRNDKAKTGFPSFQKRALGVDLCCTALAKRPEDD